MKVKIILFLSTIVGLSSQYGHKPRPEYKPQPDWEPEPDFEQQHWRPPQAQPEHVPEPWRPPPAPEHRPEAWRPPVQSEHRPEPWRPPTQPEHRPESWRPPTQPEHQPEPWRPPTPEFSPPNPEWGHRPEPKPEARCKIIPKKAYNVEFTPIAKPEITSNSVYPCDSESVVKQVSYEVVAEGSVTCNGVVVTKTDDKYDAVFQSHSYGGGKHKEALNLVNYTQIESFNNGNSDYLECGIILGGRCSGDTLWGTAIYEANDQNGCCKAGINSQTAIFRQIEIRGKCASRCSLGSSIRQYSPSVNNYGLTDRNIDNKKVEEDSDE